MTNIDDLLLEVENRRDENKPGSIDYNLLSNVADVLIKIAISDTEQNDRWNYVINLIDNGIKVRINGYSSLMKRLKKDYTIIKKPL